MKNEAGFAGHLLTIDPKTIPGRLHPLVYFVGPELKCGAPVKIGTTGNIGPRLSGLRVGSPVPLFLHSVVIGDTGLEAELHREFRKVRLHGEWFRITPTLRDRMLAFKDIYFENVRRLNIQTQTIAQSGVGG